MAGPSGGVTPPQKGLVFWGRISGVVSATQSIIQGLVGQGDGIFQNWGIYVVRNNLGSAAAPQGEQQRCTGYVSATGLFTYPAFTVPLAIGDEIYLLHPNIASILEAIGPQGMNQGLCYYGQVTAVPGANQFTCPNLAGLGAGKFSDVTAPYRAFVFRDAGGAGAAPQGEMQQVTAYVTGTGVFTTNAFTAAVAVGDEILLLNPRIAEILDILGAIGPAGFNQGLCYYGVVTAIPGANQFTIPTLAGLGAGKFSDATAPYRAFVFRDAGGAGAAPQGEMQQVTAYVTGTGAFTTNAFTAAVAVGDEILLLHPALAQVFNWGGQEAEGQAAGLNLNGGVATSGLAGADVYTIAVAGRAEVMCGLVSMRNCTPGATITVRIYTVVNGVDEQIYTQNFVQGVAPDGIPAINGHFGINENTRFEMYSNNAGDVAVNVPYKMIWRLLE